MSAQLEDGFTRIADQILEEMPKYKLNGTQYRILMVVWRYTYGFSRKEHDLSLSFFVKATGLGKTQLDRELKNLIEKRVLLVTKESTFTSARKLGFNKRMDEWDVEYSQQIKGESAKTLTVIESDEGESAKTSTGTVSKNADQDIHSFINNTTTDIESEFQKVSQHYFNLHHKELKPLEWPELTKLLNDSIPAEHIISVMDEQHKASRKSGTIINGFRYYLPRIRDNGKKTRKDEWQNYLDDFLRSDDL